jgi:hypothetical protein
MQGPKVITSRLESAVIDYCIVGGLASIAYSRPRLTLDADVPDEKSRRDGAIHLFFRFWL